MSQEYNYTAEFYKSVDSRAAETASLVFEILGRYLRVDSILDLGCGSGAWLLASFKIGVSKAIGIDLASSINLIQKNEVFQKNLADNSLILIERDFVSDSKSKVPNVDAAISLEVAEHLPSLVAEALVKLLTEAADYVIFSAAQPGQGGTYHINERPLKYWVQEFAKHGFEPYDPFRSILAKRKTIPRFYALNMLLFVKANPKANISTSITNDLNQCRISNDNELSRLTTSEHIRYAIIRHLPVRVVTILSHLIKY